MREDNLDRLSDYINIPKSDYYYLVYKPLIRDLAVCLKKFAKGRVLDIGCGNKPYEGMFKKLITEYVGSDIIQSSLNKVDYICEATKIPLPNASFDTIFSTQAIEHVADHQALVNEAYRLVKPGGYLILSGPMYWHLHEEPYDYFRFTKHGFRYILEKAGFTNLEIIANGGKWATLGQVILHTLPRRLTNIRMARRIHNWFFAYLDKNFFNEFNTMNYVAVGKK